MQALFVFNDTEHTNYYSPLLIYPSEKHHPPSPPITKLKGFLE